MSEIHITDLHETYAGDCNFSANLCSDINTLHKGVNKFLLLISRLLDRFSYYSV
jgi:hypothetical protein